MLYNKLKKEIDEILKDKESFDLFMKNTTEKTKEMNWYKIVDKDNEEAKKLIDWLVSFAQITLDWITWKKEEKDTMEYLDNKKLLFENQANRLSTIAMKNWLSSLQLENFLFIIILILRFEYLANNYFDKSKLK